MPQVYSFVPIPGAQQHKRPRRRYEEIERMYKCGWNGCEKAYGTLNHLNAHVTMQSHGQKRTPEGMSCTSSLFILVPCVYATFWQWTSIVALQDMLWREIDAESVVCLCAWFSSNTIADRLVLVLVLVCLVYLGIAREYFPMAYKLLS